MNRDRLPQLIEEIASEVAATIAMTETAAIGIRKMADETAAIQPLPEHPDPTIYLGQGDPNDPTTRAHGEWRRSEFLHRAKEDIPKALSQQWIVATYAQWDHHWRPILADAAGVSESSVKSDLFGDLRLLRNDIVHHGGVATRHNTGRCTLLRLPVGIPIYLDAAAYLTIRDSIKVRIDLHK